MTTKMTPGPWRVGDAGMTVFGPPNGNPSPETIAHVLKRSHATAIASLPDLIAENELLRAALRAIVQITDGSQLIDAPGAAMVARAALAKAA